MRRIIYKTSRLGIYDIRDGYVYDNRTRTPSSRVFDSDGDHDLSPCVVASVLAILISTTVAKESRRCIQGLLEGT